MERIIKMLKNKKYFAAISVLMLFAISGILLHGNTSDVSSNGWVSEQTQETLKEYAESGSRSLAEDEIYGIHREYMESTYGSGTNFRIVSYGASGVGYVNHETGEAALYVTDTGDER